MADAQLHELGVDRMRIAALLLRAHDRQNIRRAVHAIVGEGGDVGPVRLDIGEMQAPRRIAGGGDELHGAPRHVGRLGILLPHARGLARMAHGPARGQPVAISLGGVGPIVPGIFPGVALVVEVMVVARHLRIVAAVGPEPVQAVVALERIKSALGHAHADDRPRVDAEPLHALAVGAHVRLADQHRAHAEGAQIVAEGHLADLQGHAVPAGTVRLHIAAGVEAHARGPAHGRLHVGTREAHAVGRQSVDVRGEKARMSVARQIVEAQLVAHDEQDVLGLTHHGPPCGDNCAAPRLRRWPRA